MIKFRKQNLVIQIRFRAQISAFSSVIYSFNEFQDALLKQGDDSTISTFSIHMDRCILLLLRLWTRFSFLVLLVFPTLFSDSPFEYSALLSDSEILP